MQTICGEIVLQFNFVTFVLVGRAVFSSNGDLNNKFQYCKDRIAGYLTVTQDLDEDPGCHLPIRQRPPSFTTNGHISVY